MTFTVKTSGHCNLSKDFKVDSVSHTGAFSCFHRFRILFNILMLVLKWMRDLIKQLTFAPLYFGSGVLHVLALLSPRHSSSYAGKNKTPFSFLQLLCSHTHTHVCCRTVLPASF